MVRSEACESCPLRSSGEATDCRQLMIAGFCGNWMLGEALHEGLVIYPRDATKRPAVITQQSVEEVVTSPDYL